MRKYLPVFAGKNDGNMISDSENFHLVLATNTFMLALRNEINNGFT